MRVNPATSLRGNQGFNKRLAYARLHFQNPSAVTTVDSARWIRMAPAVALTAALFALLVWLNLGPAVPLEVRVPGTDQPPIAKGDSGRNPVLLGKLTKGSGEPANLEGAWPGFRGQARNGILSQVTHIARSWDASGPKELWSVDMGEGYAGAAVARGRVYVLDYDQTEKQDALRCLSLADGREIWRFSYPISIKRNHGMSRTVPAVSDLGVVSLGPKCHVACLNPATGELKWGIDLVGEYGATVPQWYAGQCPLMDGERVILAPGGKEVLLMAVDVGSGKPVWKTPNTNHWKMTHASVMPMNLFNKTTYVYCADKGVVGVSAEDGAVLWQTTDWKIAIATVPSAVPLPGDRVFLSGGYDAGSMMLQLVETEGRIIPKVLFRLDAATFGATQQTPIFHQGHIYGVRPDGRFTCLSPEGKVVWTSDVTQRFGMGPFLLAGDLFFVMNDSGKLSLIEATPDRFSLVAQAQVLKGRESWAPMAFADGRLIVRDLTRMVCLDVRPTQGE